MTSALQLFYFLFFGRDSWKQRMFFSNFFSKFPSTWGIFEKIFKKQRGTFVFSIFSKIFDLKNFGQNKKNFFLKFFFKCKTFEHCRNWRKCWFWKNPFYGGFQNVVRLKSRFLVFSTNKVVTSALQLFGFFENFFKKRGGLWFFRLKKCRFFCKIVIFKARISTGLWGFWVNKIFRKSEKFWSKVVRLKSQFLWKFFFEKFSKSEGLVAWFLKILFFSLFSDKVVRLKSQKVCEKSQIFQATS